MTVTSYCGADCENCGIAKNGKCLGCRESNGCPFGEKCFIASYIKLGGIDAFLSQRKILMQEINELHFPGLPDVTELYALSGDYVNLTYPLPSGACVPFLDSKKIYLGTQLPCLYGDETDERCFGIVADMSFILIAAYGMNGENPELLLYKKR